MSENDELSILADECRRQTQRCDDLWLEMDTAPNWWRHDKILEELELLLEAWGKNLRKYKETKARRNAS
jgi:hypothetical protein